MSAAVVAATVILFYQFDRSFFWKDDFQLQYLPCSRDVVRAWSEGSFPLLSRYSWFGGALAGEFQHSVFSLFGTICYALVWSLPLELGARAAMLSTIHLAVMAAGVFLLGRSYGMRAALATAAAFAVTLNGWNLWWGAATWLPSLASFAWLPWYWLALRKTSTSRLAWLGGGLALYCLVTAGWPYTIVMAALVTLLEGLKALRSPRALLPIAGAGALGLALSAPATLMLLDYYRVSYRSDYGDLVDIRWTLPLRNLIGLALPTLRTQWRLWLVSMPHSAVEMAGGLVPLAGLVAAAATRRWRALRSVVIELIFLELVVLLASRPSPGVLRWPFRWLPLLHLLLAMAGFAVIQQISDEASRFRDRVGVWCCAVLGVALAVDWAIDLQPAVTLRYGLVLFVLAALWGAAATRANVAGALVVTIASIAVLFVAFPQPREVPRWHIDRSILDPRPLDPSRRYLQLAQWPEDLARPDPAQGQRLVDGIGASLRPGDTPMLAGVEFINGYSPVVPYGLRALLGFDAHGPIREEFIDVVGGRETAPGALLDHMSVDGLVVARRWVAAANAFFGQRGWSPAGRVADGALFTRPLRHGVVWSAASALMFAREREATAWIRLRRGAAMPVVLLGGGPEQRTYAPRRLTDLRNDRLTASAVIGPAVAPRKSLIVFSRPWYPGYVATINGRELPVLRADLMMPAVELDPDEQGLLVLRYRPNALVAGVAIAAAGALATIVALSRMVGRSRPAGRPTPAEANR